jgi:hypothetical protein
MTAACASPPSGCAFSAASTAENGSSKGRFMKTWPSACTTSTWRPPVAGYSRAPRPGAALAKFKGRIRRGSPSMNPSMSF